MAEIRRPQLASGDGCAQALCDLPSDLSSGAVESSGARGLLIMARRRGIVTIKNC